MVISDDSGLEVDVLNGIPGVYSARYAGEPEMINEIQINYSTNSKARPIEKAQFRTIITLMSAENSFQFEGIVSGTIAKSPRGKAGFGYDPVFVPEGYQHTFAELQPIQKIKSAIVPMRLKNYYISSINT